jgi:hypothetical protein
MYSTNHTKKSDNPIYLLQVLKNVIHHTLYIFEIPHVKKGTRTRLDRPESGIVEQSFIGIKTAEGKQNFKTCLYFLNFKLISPSGILPTLSALHAICRFRMQFALKGI